MDKAASGRGPQRVFPDAAGRVSLRHCEALPDKTSAGRTAAISLCQNPTCESVLVVGSGLGLCDRLLQLPQIKSVAWAHPDVEYALGIEAFIPVDMRIADARLQRLRGDIRATLAGREQSYDIVIVNLPEAASSVLNRYYTLEFYEQIKGALKPDGVVAVRATGGENIMGTELINLGASIRLTLKRVFSQLVLTPGEETWFIASDSNELTPDPAVLRDRWASIEASSDVFSPEALLTVYLPERAAAAIERYSAADLPERLLINQDSRPLTFLHSLLLTARQSGAPLTRLVKLLALAGPWTFLVPLLVFVVLRLLYIHGTGRPGGRGASGTGFDSSFLVFSAGWVGIGTVIVLMYLYQTYFGSLYLHIGIISSLFMVGLTAGAALIRRALRNATSPEKGRISLPETVLLIVVTAHVIIIAAMAFTPGERWGRAAGAAWESSHLIFAGAFILSGMCAGCYFPIAARRLADCGFESGQAGSRLETADHLGASAGGAVTSLALVPVLGAKATLLFFSLLILTNIPSAALTMLSSGRLSRGEMPGLLLRRVGYVLLGVAATVVVCSNILVHAGAKLRASLPYHTAQALAGELRLSLASITTGREGEEIDYFTVHEADPNAAESSAADSEPAGYIFSTEDLAPDVRGFGGRINLAVYVNAGGELIDFHIVRSNETPSYLELLTEWRVNLKGLGLFESRAGGQIDTVSGATVSSEAILSALRASGERFASDALGLSVEGTAECETRAGRYLPDIHAVYLIGAFVLALIVTHFGGFRSRLAMLVVTVVLGGIILNAQYSIEQIATLLSLQSPAVQLSGAFLLVVGVPVLVGLFGNIYCGYVCPFGAAQELLGYIVPARFKPRLGVEDMRRARFVKYIVLFVVIIAFFLSRDRTTLAADPLVSVFNLRFSVSDIRLSIFNLRSPTVLILAVVLLGSLFYVRFWCRYLCPAGAFLSLFNKIALLRRYLPAKRFGKCEFGLTDKDRLDCIYCDRCRYEARASTGAVRLADADDARHSGLFYCFAIAVIAVALIVSSFSRDVDLQKVQALIREGKLSDKEAEFYKKLH